MCRAGVDGIQFDKVAPEQLIGIVGAIRSLDPRTVILAAGGINESNIEEYAKTGVNAVVTTSVYHGRPVDIGVTMTRA
ncbi:MAG: hypothetical protein ABSC17_09570 [Thermacetogeniaceae bacterium]